MYTRQTAAKVKTNEELDQFIKEKNKTVSLKNFRRAHETQEDSEKKAMNRFVTHAFLQYPFTRLQTVYLCMCDPHLSDPRKPL